jgi:GntR family transcriptional regulator
MSRRICETWESLNWKWKGHEFQKVRKTGSMRVFDKEREFHRCGNPAKSMRLQPRGTSYQGTPSACRNNADRRATLVAGSALDAHTTFLHPSVPAVVQSGLHLTRTVPSVIVHIVIPFRVEFRPGLSIYEQIVYAAKKAIIAGQIRPGDSFPSVRALSKELKINPNTAHKVVAALISAGLLETQPGIGTVVAALPEARNSERAQLLGPEIEQIVVEAKKLGLEIDQVLDSVSAHWKRLTAPGTSRIIDQGGRGKK